MPQPIDAPSEIGRAIMAERVQSTSDRAVTAHQIRSSDDVREERISSETQVQETPDTQNERIHPDGRRRNPLLDRSRKKHKKSSSKGETKSLYTAEERKDVPEDPEEHSFDVSV